MMARGKEETGQRLGVETKTRDDLSQAEGMNLIMWAPPDRGERGGDLTGVDESKIEEDRTMDVGEDRKVAPESEGDGGVKIGDEQEQGFLAVAGATFHRDIT
jgi:hypothetical protein